MMVCFDIFEALRCVVVFSPSLENGFGVTVFESLFKSFYSVYSNTAAIASTSRYHSSFMLLLTGFPVELTPDESAIKHAGREVR